jgi:hypothetical protein
VPVLTKASETKVLSSSMSHKEVGPKSPVTVVPSTWQTIVTGVPSGTEPTTGKRVPGPERLWRGMPLLFTVPVAIAILLPFHSSVLTAKPRQAGPPPVLSPSSVCPRAVVGSAPRRGQRKQRHHGICCSSGGSAW